jgi:selenocysteine-specific elongation factor
MSTRPAEPLEARRIVVATAGHVDHGKTSLVRALTGVDTDRLPEEKRRGISIELGFAELEGAGVSFIDVPGHERLVHTMIAGVGGVDALLVVVAADDGVMPQTREHLAVGSVLGVRRLVVALSKCDLVDPETLDIAEADVREALAAFGLEALEVVRTSTATGQGIPELERALRRLVAAVPARPASARVWLSVDRTFSLPGAGTIVTGTLTRGTLREGDIIYVATRDALLESACRGLQEHGRRVRQAQAPTRVAVNLARLDLHCVRRGDVLTKDPELVRSRRLDALIHWLEGAPEAFSRQAPAIVHLGTTRVQARVVRLGSDTAHLVLDHPVPCEGGQGIVLRGFAARRDFGRIVGGGRVLDALAPSRPRRRDAVALEERVASLRALARGDLTAGLLGLIRGRAPRPVVEVDVERRLGLEPGTVVTALTASAPSHRVVRLAHDRGWTTPEALDHLVETAIALLRRYHVETPHERGAPSETVRAALARSGGRHAAAQALELAIESRRILAVDPGGVCLPEFAQATAHLHNEATNRLRAALDLVALEGATEPEIIQRAGVSIEEGHAALARLAKRGEAKRLSGLWFGEGPLARLRAAVRAHFLSHATLSVPRFKELFAVSRKQAIPLLEDLDQQGVTKRRGDDRVAGAVAAGLAPTPAKPTPTPTPTREDE